MTRLQIFLAALAPLLFVFAGDALAVNEGKWPNTLVDANCTDAKDTTATFTTLRTRYVESTTGGGANGKCDHDNRIITGPITVDTYFGPFKTNGRASLILFVDADTIVAGSATWRIRIGNYRPHDLIWRTNGSFAEQSTSGNSLWVLGPAAWNDLGTVNETIANNVPDTFYLWFDLNTATSWDGSVSWKTF